MKQLEITKGNWELLQDEYWCEVQIENPLQSICAVNSNIEEFNANGKLISTAPKLYEALKDLVRYCEDNNVGAELEFAKDILFKASS
jgi:hypothetical protein